MCLPLTVLTSPGSAGSCRWALRNVYREGDVLHLTAVVKCLMPNMEVFHSAPGTAFSFRQPGEHHEQELINAAKSQLEARWVRAPSTDLH